MLKRFLTLSVVAGSILIAPLGQTYAEGVSIKSSGFSKLYDRKLRRRLVNDYLDNGLRTTATPPSFVRIDSNSSAASISGSGNSFVFYPKKDIIPLHPVSDVTYVDDDMVALAENRAEWRAAQGRAEQVQSIVVIAGSSPHGDRVDAPTFMPDTFSEAVDDDTEVTFLSE